MPPGGKASYPGAISPSRAQNKTFASKDATNFQLGWEEWLSLTGLGLPAIKAKADTGAKTSALHASVTEPFGPASSPQVRFLIQPDPNDPGLEVTCSAPVEDLREVISSNGDRELSYVIETHAEMGALRRPIQLTLSNRETMTYRMLPGRAAIQPNMVIDPNASFRQPQLGHELCSRLPERRPARRPLRIALLTPEPRNHSSRRLIDAAQTRGHVIGVIDTARKYIGTGTVDAEVHYDGNPLPRYDAVIPRAGSSITDYGMAVLRQFSETGAYCLKGAVTIGRSCDKLLAHQMLARAKIVMPVSSSSISKPSCARSQNSASRCELAQRALNSRPFSVISTIINDTAPSTAKPSINGTVEPLNCEPMKAPMNAEASVVAKP